MPRPLTAALAVALLGLFAVGWGYPNQGGRLCDYPPWVADDVRWLPPGAVECHRHPTGSTTEHRLALPWQEWIAVLLVAASAGLFVAALRARGGRIVKAAVAYALFLAVVLAWFFEEPLIWATLTAITAALVASARGWGVRRSAALR
jgi:hypothetical protein